MQIAMEFDGLVVKPSALKVAYFIWRKPYMVAGSDTFIDAMLKKCGLINVVTQGRYPELDEQMLLQLQPDIILLSSEPYPFKEKHLAEFRALLPGAKIKLVDGELFSWYGSRLLKAPAYFEKLLVNLKSV
jgi:ABC-type Fe3+-hydroxamate transport system substrate-binding protein